jgi:hypothetical protein
MPAPQVQKDVEVGGWPEALDRRHGAPVGLVGLETRLHKQLARDDAMHHLQHGRDS